MLKDDPEWKAFKREYDKHSHSPNTALWVIIGLVICLFHVCNDRAHAQSIRDTTLTFTTDEDLYRQLLEIEGKCDTTMVESGEGYGGWDSVKQAYYYEDILVPEITCREIAWVIKKESTKTTLDWPEIKEAIVAWREVRR